MDDFKKRGRPRKNVKETIEQKIEPESISIQKADEILSGENGEIGQGWQEVLDFGASNKIKFRVDFDGSVVKDHYHKAQATSHGIKCEAERTENGVYARILDYGWWSLEMQYEGTEPIGEKLVNRIGYDFAPPWEDKKTRKPKYFSTLDEAIKAIIEFLNTQEAHNQQIENSSHAVQYNAPGRYQAIGV